MSRGRRYDTEPKLNMKKVFAVAIAIIVIYGILDIIDRIIFMKKIDNYMKD